MFGPITPGSKLEKERQRRKNIAVSWSGTRWGRGYLDLVKTKERGVMPLRSNDRERERRGRERALHHELQRKIIRCCSLRLSPSLPRLRCVVVVVEAEREREREREGRREPDNNHRRDDVRHAAARATKRGKRPGRGRRRATGCAFSRSK